VNVDTKVVGPGLRDPLFLFKISLKTGAKPDGNLFAKNANRLRYSPGDSKSPGE
jgi:hypothetical protein